MNHIHVDDYLFYKILKLIDDGDIQDVIDYAKKENVLGERINTWQRCVTERIKERLDREGLDYEIVRPE